MDFLPDGGGLLATLTQITTWRTQLLEGAAGVFSADSAAEAAEPAVDLKKLHAKIGELTLANDFLAGALGMADLLPSAKRCSIALTGFPWPGMHRN